MAVPVWPTTEVGRAMILGKRCEANRNGLGVYASERLSFTVSERPLGERAKVKTGIGKSDLPETIALLPWFEFQGNSSAIDDAYSYPNETALTALSAPQALNCGSQAVRREICKR